MAKILVLDVEWRPTKAYVWQPWKQDITPDKIIQHGGLLCVTTKWLGEKATRFWAEWENKDEMLKGVHADLSECDAVVTYNGDKYDLPKLMGEFLLAGLTPPPPPTSIDVLKTIKKMGLFMNRLAFVGPFLGIGSKVQNGGFQLWRDVEEGKPAAYAKMKRYNIQDVVLLEKLYRRVLPYIRNHPFMGDRGACGACDGRVLHKRGYRRTKSMKIERLQCQTCGSWQDGKKEKV